MCAVRSSPLAEEIRIKNHKGWTIFSQYEACKILQSLFLAIESLHSLNIVHWDIKNGNILMKKKDEELTIALTDFGLSFNPAEKIDDEKSRFYGCSTFSAPEVFAKNSSSTVRDFFKNDIYALGCTLYELTHEAVPWEESMEELDEAVKGGKLLQASHLKAKIHKKQNEVWFNLKKNINNPLSCFISRLLDPNPETRPSLTECKTLLEQLKISSPVFLS